MDDLRQQHGTHTWDLVIDYYHCPNCGYILEDRQKFEYRLGLYQKDLNCPRCHRMFTVTRRRRHTFGPLLGHE